MIKKLANNELNQVAGGDIITFRVGAKDLSAQNLRNEKLKQIKNIESLNLQRQLSYKNKFYLVCDNFNETFDMSLTGFKIFFNKSEALTYAKKESISLKEYNMFYIYAEENL